MVSAYTSFVEKHGGARIFGGASDDKNLTNEYKKYMYSAESESKRDFLKKLLKIFGDMKFEVPTLSSDADSSEVQKVADELKSVVYNTLKSDIKEGNRSKICKALGKLINDQFGDIVDVKLGDDAICDQVEQFCLSFAQGLHIEYFRVQADLKKSIGNIKLLIGVMKKLHKYVSGLIDAAKDSELSESYRDAASVYGNAEAELERQLGYLEQLLNVTVPYPEEQLKNSLKEGSDLKSIIKSLGISTDDFKSSKSASNIVQALLGVATVGVIAAKVHRALHETGMKSEVFFKTSNLNELIKKLDSLAIEHGVDHPARFEKARKVLEDVYKDSSDDTNEWEKLSSELEKSGGVQSRFEVLNPADLYDDKGEENYDKDGKKKSTLTKELEESKRDRVALIKSFSRQLENHYNDFLAAIQSVVPKLGKSIKITEKTNLIRTHIKQLNNNSQFSNRIELALIGLYNDVGAREAREKYINALEGIAKACEGVDGFGELKDVIEKLVTLINHFYKVTKEKFGGAKEGGGEYEDILPEVARSSLTLKKAINDFVYFYYIAKIKANFRATSEEIESVSDDYVKLMGAAVANRIVTMEKEYDDYKKQFDGSIAGTAYPAAAKDPTESQNAAKTVGGDKQDYEEYMKFHKNRIDTFKNFYDAVQAVDLYLKEFTVETIKNPEQVLELKKMIQDTEIINNWFNDTTGNLLCDFFNTDFNNSNLAANIDIGKTPDYYSKQTDKHYYEIINEDFEKAVGSWAPAKSENTSFNLIKSYDDVKKVLDKIFDNFSALKNLINTFAKIGYMGKKDVFLPPSQLCKYLTEFIKNSAIEAIWNKNDNSVPPRPVTNFPTVDAIILQPSTIQPNYNSKFETMYFSLVIKAIMSKILTTIGLYEVMTNITPINQITNARIILGGGSETVEPIAEASELYFRLPRLIEYYRNVLCYTKLETLPANVLDYKISLLPDIEGVFSSLIRFIFKREVGNNEYYSDEELRTLINEINIIYHQFKSKGVENICMSVVSELIAEVNRKFGVIKKTDMANYYKELDAMNDAYNATSLTDETNYKLFTNEDNPKVGKAPSDVYGIKGDKDIRTFSSDRQIADHRANPTNDLKQIFEDFRQGIDKSFEKIDKNNFEFSYDIFIKQGERKIRNSSTNSDKLQAAFSLIQNTSKITTSSIKLFMFQESIIAGLASLYSIYSSIRQFEYNIHILESVQENVKFTLNNVGAVFSINEMQKLFPDKSIEDVDLQNSILFMTSMLNIRPVFVAGIGAIANRPAGAIPNIDDIMNDKINNPNINIWRNYAKLLINNESMLRVLLENVFNFVNTSQGLVTMSYSSGGEMLFNYSKLRESINQILTSVKKNIDLFKPYIDSSIIDAYEDKKKEGSIYWLEEHLVYYRFEKRKPDNICLLDNTIEKNNNILKYLIKGTCAVTYVNCTLPEPNINTFNENVTYPYGVVLGKMIYEINDNNQEITIRNETGIQDAFIGQMFVSRSDDTSWKTYHKVMPVQAAVGNPPTPVKTVRLYNYDSRDNIVIHKSILQMLNQLLQQYLERCAETSGTYKIYSNLINSFCSSVVSTLFADKTKAFPDTFQTVALNANANVDDIITITDTYFRPDTESVIFYSLVQFLETVLKETPKNSTILSHIVSSLTDVPLFVKEQLRCNLPFFDKAFMTIVQKCEFLKQFISKSGVNTDSRLFKPAFDNDTSDYSMMNGGESYIFTDTNCYSDITKALRPYYKSKQSMSSDLKQILTKLSDCAYSLSSTCQEVLKELGDSPIFYQTGESSIEMYERRHSSLPIMPYSLYISKLSKISTITPMLFTSIGTQAFKENYGIRGLLNGDKLSYEQLPFVKKILAEYNDMSSSSEKISENEYLEYVNCMNKIFTITIDNAFKYLLNSTIFINQPFKLFNPIVPYCSKYEIVDTIEESNQDDYNETLIKMISHISDIKDRNDEIYANIIDMNIIPFNVHLLMRDIPLVNIYNYAYTYDNIMKNLMNVKKDDPLDPSNAGTRYLFYKLMTNPYMEINQSHYIDLQNFFVGDDSLGMGRPKFLSDQLYNKVFLQSVYDNRHNEELRAVNTNNLTYTNDKLREDFYKYIIQYATSIEKIIKDIMKNTCIQQHMTQDEKMTINKILSNVYLRGTVNKIIFMCDRISPLATTPQDATIINNIKTSIENVNAKLKNDLGNPRINDDVYISMNNSLLKKYNEIKTNQNKKYLDKGVEHCNLTFIKDNTLKSIQITGMLYSDLSIIFKYRFNTILIRNMIFITNCNRVLRQVFDKELTYSRDVIKHGDGLASASMTEFGSYPMLPNETYGSRRPDGLAAFSSNDKPLAFVGDI